jgi:hypothetical protein
MVAVPTTQISLDHSTNARLKQEQTAAAYVTCVIQQSITTNGNE